MTALARAAWRLGPFVAAVVSACSSSRNATDDAPYSRDKLLDPQTCNECHSQHYEEWSGSMHAYASTDPVFRAMNARGQKETNGALGDFCVKCHAPMAVNENAITDFSDISNVPQRLQGITCYFCHNVTDVTDTHNNPLKLANDVTMRAGIQNPLKYKGHTAEYSKLHDDDVAQAGFQSSSLCGSCHDIVVPNHFSGAPQDVRLEQTFTEWKGSVFADPTSPNALNCSSGSTCHMGREFNVPIASPPLPHQTMPARSARHLHDFAAIDVALTDFPQKDAQLAAVKAKLGLEFRILICVDPQLGSGITLTLENLNAGHFFPSGAAQDRRVWTELHAYQKGTEIMSNGVVPTGVAAVDVPETWVIYQKALKADGTTPAHMFWDVASLTTPTIPVSTAANINGNVIGHPPFDIPRLADGKIAYPDTVDVTIWVEPVGLDVLNDLVASKFLDESVRAAMPRIPVILANSPPDAGVPTPVTFRWTLADAMGPNGSQSNGRLCVENAQTKFAPSPPP